MPPLATVALFVKPERFSIKLAKISVEKSKVSSAIHITLVNEPGLEMFQKRFFYLDLQLQQVQPMIQCAQPF